MTLAALAALVGSCLWVVWLAVLARALWELPGYDAGAGAASADPQMRKLVRVQSWWTDPALGGRHRLLLRSTAVVVLFETLAVEVP